MIAGYGVYGTPPSFRLCPKQLQSASRIFPRRTAELFPFVAASIPLKIAAPSPSLQPSLPLSAWPLYRASHARHDLSPFAVPVRLSVSTQTRLGRVQEPRQRDLSRRASSGR